MIGALIMAWTGLILAGWRASDDSFAMALWLGLAVLVLGAVTLAGIGPKRPSLLYPLTLIVAFIAFAIPYNALDEPWQSAMPAAGSIACLIGLVAAIYTTIAFLRPRRRSWPGRRPWRLCSC